MDKPLGKPKRLRHRLLAVASSALGFRPFRRAAIFTRDALTIWMERQAVIATRRLAGKDLEVQQGPFRGMRLDAQFMHELAFARKLLGTFESELHETFKEFAQNHYEAIIDVGAAEGYYAIGLARMFEGQCVTAYETKENRRALILDLARTNGVEKQVVIKGSCTIDGFKTDFPSPSSALLVADCTGFELELLDPVKIPTLARMDIVMELHELNAHGPTVTQLITRRFSGTHDVDIVNVRPLKPMDGASLKDIYPEVLSRILSEGRRFSVGWAVLRSKTLRQIQPAY